MVRIDFERKVGPKGQVVIPEEIRRITGITPSTKVLITVENSYVLIRKERKKISEWLERVIKKDGKKLKVKDMHKWYEEELLERWKAAKGG